MPSAVRWFFGRCLCAPALLLPYGARTRYVLSLSLLFHLPFKLFGRIARYLLDRLEIEPVVADAPPPAAGDFPVNSLPPAPRYVLLFSGGTDSTCAAALAAQVSPEIHLLTFEEAATRRSPMPFANVERLRRKFPETKFVDRQLCVDELVRFFSYDDYVGHWRRHGWLVLATCGFSTLSWHTRTIRYCLEHGIENVADGLTRELMHFPGHMDVVIRLLRDLYGRFGITYHNPVRLWPVPPDQQLVDRVIVNRYENDFFSSAHPKTTGRYLYEHGIFPAENVKGSKLDFGMQHDCYPFALYNILAFWGFLSVEPYELFCERIGRLMEEKMRAATRVVDGWQANDAKFLRLLGPPRSN